MMDSRRQADEALIEALLEGQQTGRIGNAKGLDTLDFDEGLAIQLAVLDRQLAAGAILAGWKVGMTSGAALDRMGKGFRPFGYILQHRLLASGSTVAMGPAGPAGIEPELGFRVEQPLRGAAISPDDVRSVISGAIATFELLAFRRGSDAADGAMIADNLTHWGIVLGGESTWRGDVAEIEVTLDRDGLRLAAAGPRFTIDDPFRSIAALCSMLDRFGRGLEPGQHVITGAFHKIGLSAGTWSAGFKGLGGVTVTAA